MVEYKHIISKNGIDMFHKKVNKKWIRVTNREGLSKINYLKHQTDEGNNYKRLLRRCRRYGISCKSTETEKQLEKKVDKFEKTWII